MMMVPGTRESLDEDSITSYILQDEAMQEAEQPTELLPQANYATTTKLNQQQGHRRKPGGGGSGSGQSTKEVDEKRSTRDTGRGGGGQRRECWICHDLDHLSYECPDRDDSDEDDTKGGHSPSTSRRPRRDAKPRKEKQTLKKTSSTKDVDNSSGKSRGDGEASCSMVGVVEPTVSLAPEADEDFQAVAAAVQANPIAVLLDRGCSHHLMGTKAVFVNMAPSGDVKHLKESGVQMQGDGDEMLLVAAITEVLGRARYNGRVICTDLRPCSTRSLSTEVVALRTIASVTKSTPDRLHARLAHVGVDTFKISAKHDVATGINIKPSTGADPPCVLCVRGKLAWHTFPDKGSDAKEALAVVHIDLCGPFRVAAKDGSLYFLLLKDRHTRFVWVMPDAKKSDVLREFQKWLQNGMAEREMRTAVESVRTMLLHMGVQHHRWHLALRQAVWVRNCLERSTTPPGTNLYQLLIEKKPNLTLARVWGCMVQFMVPEQQRGGKLAPKARWGLHLGVSPKTTPVCCAAMASLRVLAFDEEGRPIQFDTWLDDLQLYLLSDSKDNASLFDLASGAATAPPATADSATRSQWLTRDAAARLAIRNHLPLAECAHFGQHRRERALYDAVVARFSSPATASLGRLLLPYLFPKLSAFAMEEDLVSHLHNSEARYCATVPTDFLDRNQPPMDHFLSLDPTSLTVDLLEEHLIAAETSAVAIGAARGTSRTPFIEGCSPSPLDPSQSSAIAANVPGIEDVGAASASAKCRSGKCKGGRSGGSGSGGGGGGSSRGGGSGGSGGGSGGVGGGGGGSDGSGSNLNGGSGGGRTGAQCGGSRGGQRQRQKRRSETPSPQQLHEWLFQRGASGGSVSCSYVIRTGDRAGQTCGKEHTQHRCFFRLDDAWRAEFGDEVERPHWAELLSFGVATFDLDYDAILSAMYALSASAKGDCYRCVPPDLGIDAAALGASESVLPGAAPAEALHTFMLDSGASRCFFRDSTTLTPLPALVPIRLADPSGGPLVAHSSTVLPCSADLSGSLSGLHLPSFSTNLVSTAALKVSK
ncbi:unnamed protein product [Closterium sp. NIES-53]